MAIINFSKAKALRVLKASVERNSPIHFVKDQGVYIMVFGEKDDDSINNVVEYGAGFDPQKTEFDDWYHKAGSILGGDDFGVDFDNVDWFRKLIELKDRWTTFRVHVTQKHFKLSVK